MSANWSFNIKMMIMIGGMMKIIFKKMLYNIHYNNVIINCKYLIIFYAFINSFVSIILSFLGFIIVIRPLIF